MFSGHYHVRRDGGDLGKFSHVPVIGGHHVNQRGYRKHQYEVASRKIGLTLKRTMYNVTIHGEQGERLTFLTDLPSQSAAEKAAEAWIDRTIRRRPKGLRPIQPKPLAE